MGRRPFDAKFGALADRYRGHHEVFSMPVRLAFLPSVPRFFGSRFSEALNAAAGLTLSRDTALADPRKDARHEWHSVKAWDR